MSFTRLSLIAAAAMRFSAPVPQPKHLCAVPHSCQGSRIGLADACLTPSERAVIKRDLLTYRIKRDLSKPVNPFALALIQR